jgi:glycine cleavage system regulatory protein
MTKDIVIGFIGEDQPGIISLMSQAVVKHGGNWQASRMSRLAGFFSGIAEIQIDEEEIPSLTQSLEALEGLSISILNALTPEPAAASQLMRLNIIGPDRKGILSDVSRKLAGESINVVEMQTSIGPAPMSGEPMFTADAEVVIPLGTDIDDLTTQLNLIADDLGVDVLIEDAT